MFVGLVVTFIVFLDILWVFKFREGRHYSMLCLNIFYYFKLVLKRIKNNLKE